MTQGLADLTVVTICKVGQGGRTCRYLIMVPELGWACAKLHPPLKAVIEDRAEHDPEFTAISDNCEGVDMTDPVHLGLQKHVDDGNMEIMVEDGQLKFKLTELGQQRARDIMETEDGFAFWAEMTGLEDPET